MDLFNSEREDQDFKSNLFLDESENKDAKLENKTSYVDHGSDLHLFSNKQDCEIKKNKHKKDLDMDEREKMQVLVSNFTEDQLDRYEMYRRSAFPKAAVKRIMQMITGNSVSQNVVIAMAGITKVFIGEAVEGALDVMIEQNELGPIQPKHLRESVRRLRLKGKIPSMYSRKLNLRL